MPQSMLSLTVDQFAFAEQLFELYPNFLPTRSLYVDLEGSGSGNEQVVSFLWPQNPSPTRFQWVMAGPGEIINGEIIEEIINGLGVDVEALNSVVVYSAGGLDPQERSRVIELLDYDPWPDSTWVNLLLATQRSSEMSAAIKAHRHVVFKRDRKQVRRSLEALEWEFGIVRPPQIRGHNNKYSDGLEGEMHPLQSASDYSTGQLDESEQRWFKSYCRQDVESMFTIARTCERGIFSSSERAKRTRQHREPRNYSN
jgi:hypothetical protein